MNLKLINTFLIVLIVLVLIQPMLSKNEELPQAQVQDEDDEVPVMESFQEEPLTVKKSVEANVPLAYDNTEAQMDFTNPESSKIDLGKCGGGQFLSTNLLPKEDPKLDDSFAEFKPKPIAGNFIDAHKYAIGTQSQSLRNGNLQLRSEPANPQTMVCPWSQSTINPDANRPQLEIGSN